MRYWSNTIAEDTGEIKYFNGVPFEDKFPLKKRLHDSRPFASHEWSSQAVAVFDEEWLDDVDWKTCDTFTFLLYPVISPRFKALLEHLLGADAIEFLPVRMCGLQTGLDLGVYYIPHLLQSYDCLDHERIRHHPTPLLHRSRIPSEARAFIAPDPVHTRLIFRDDVVDAIRRAHITGIDFYEVELDDAPFARNDVPLGMLLYTTVEEQQAWLRQALAQGAYGFVIWQRWDEEDSRLCTRVGQIRTEADVDKVPWQLSEAEAEATVKLAVYLSRAEWRERVRFAEVEGELESGGLGEWLNLHSADTVGTGWYGRWEVGYQVGTVLTEASWFLPLGWQYELLEAFEPLYRWWEQLGDWYEAQRVADVSVRSGRREDRELDEAVWVTEGAVRWYVGGGQLCREWGAKPLRLVGRGLRRYRSG